MKIHLKSGFVLRFRSVIADQAGVSRRGVFTELAGANQSPVVSRERTRGAIVKKCG